MGIPKSKDTSLVNPARLRSGSRPVGGGSLSYSQSSSSPNCRQESKVAVRGRADATDGFADLGRYGSADFGRRPGLLGGSGYNKSIQVLPNGLASAAARASACVRV
eukprot:TRINITY_DN10436_c0_g2_i2.p2 TRINITY_DN10436_c0_g2~~TRINITY_DN10436_c0_g2_i2.p2  ORF type:complete len:106 (+),score=4.67 TRINITY_DN10436_c0_g2_i2:645-962(+)